MYSLLLSKYPIALKVLTVSAHNWSDWDSYEELRTPTNQLVGSGTFCPDKAPLSFRC